MIRNLLPSFESISKKNSLNLKTVDFFVKIMNVFRDFRAAVKKIRLLSFTSGDKVDNFREKIEKTYKTVFLPNHVECNEREFGGVMCDMLIPEVYSSKRIMLYVHGGSFVGGSRDSWRNFCASLANVASCRVVVPEFRLPPTHLFPSSLEDIKSVAEHLIAEEKTALSLEDDENNRKPEIIIAGDGSGASIACAYVLGMGEAAKSDIKELLLFSPWLDLSSESPFMSGRKISDEVISSDCLRRSADVYAAKEDLDKAEISILRATDEQLSNFPSVFIQMGSREALLKQAQAFSARLSSLGVNCTLDVWKDMPFMFQMADEYLPESHLAIEKIGSHYTARQ
mgnify:FL=1